LGQHICGLVPRDNVRIIELLYPLLNRFALIEFFANQ
jgi:hypothetical protein